MVETARSLWLDELIELGTALPSRTALQGDHQVDVAIVGGGFTGLWTAYYLARLDPSLTVLVIEKAHVGFGASGRNGGWVVGELAAGIGKYAERSGLEESLRLTRAMFDAVDEVGRIIDAEAIDCGYAKGGVIRMARNRPQLQRQVEEVAHHHRLGITDEQIRLLDKRETEAIINATQILGGVMFAPCAAVDPARLVLGLAAACEKAGVTIVERTAVDAIGPRRVVTETGTINASVVVQATEAYTRDLKGQRRRLAPFYSRMLATEPLSEDVLAQIGLANRPTFADDRHMVIYGQRTSDGRIAFGGRGVPYLYGSRISPSMEVRPDSHRLVHEALVDLFPILADAKITHRWGGVLGVPRNWTPFIDYDRANGIATAGGYVGEGVAAANLAGRTVADLITNTDSERVDLPWVAAAGRSWEPEPLRWLGVRGSRRIMARADDIENRRGSEARMAMAISRWLRGG
ncbi:MAG: FAD-binding oxidoreductase [Acidimicrobiaceae bacterium]|nr:FAD-binding oxidoreductase [Acidimicrobiaceae bacterium]